jgi:hypothetical protein
MFDLEKIDISLSFNPVFLLVAVIIAAGYSLYIYRYTVPVVSSSKKVLLLSLRILALFFLLLIIFEPLITITQKIILEPVNLIFLDNSRSILIDDGTNRKETIKNFLNDAATNGFESNSQLILFGSKNTVIGFDSTSKLNFSEGSTNFSKIFLNIDEQKLNISSIVIVSDGVITEGSSPLYTAEKRGIPVFTVGVGDTTAKKDIEIKNVLFNEYIYSDAQTTINTTIINKGFEGKNITASFLENNLLVEQKNLLLSKDGIQNLSFNYLPKTGGEKKLSIILSPLEGEFTTANNNRVFYINVLDNKINILLLAGSPSNDLSFVKNSLQRDKNLSVNSITLISPNKFIENNNRDKLLDSADILFLIGFPSKETPDQFWRKVISNIIDKSKPFFLTLSGSVDISKLQMLQNELPFTIKNISKNFIEVQPDISAGESKNPLLQNNSDNQVSAWNNLPPISQPDLEITAKPESNVISRIRINNIPVNKPLILSRRIGGKSSVVVAANEIWRWKLQTAAKDLDLFDSFINNSIKWLNTSEEQKQVSINTSKKIYSIGEEIEFIGQVYNQTFNPVSDAEVEVKITSGNDNNKITLNSIGGGLYEGTFQTNKPGDYYFSGDALLDGKKLGTDKGSFNIGEVDIEMLDPRSDYEFLYSLANHTGGKYFDASNYNELFRILDERNKNLSREKISSYEIQLWSNEWLMAVIILLLGVEWFLRKRSGML